MDESHPHLLSDQWLKGLHPHRYVGSGNCTKIPMQRDLDCSVRSTSNNSAWLMLSNRLTSLRKPAIIAEHSLFLIDFAELVISYTTVMADDTSVLF